MENKVKELRELQRMAAELEEMIEGIKESIKKEMATQEVDRISGLDWSITWKPVTSTRLDSKKMMNDFPDLCKDYIITTTNRRFCLA